MSQTLAPPADIAVQIADALGETAPEPRAWIARDVRLLGAECVQAFADQVRDRSSRARACSPPTAAAGAR